jgi:hypothetical protein
MFIQRWSTMCLAIAIVTSACGHRKLRARVPVMEYQASPSFGERPAPAIEIEPKPANASAIEPALAARAAEDEKRPEAYAKPTSPEPSSVVEAPKKSASNKRIVKHRPKAERNKKTATLPPEAPEQPSSGSRGAALLLALVPLALVAVFLRLKKRENGDSKEA